MCLCCEEPGPADPDPDPDPGPDPGPDPDPDPDPGPDPGPDHSRKNVLLLVNGVWLLL